MCQPGLSYSKSLVCFDEVLWQSLLVPFLIFHFLSSWQVCLFQPETELEIKELKMHLKSQGFSAVDELQQLSLKQFIRSQMGLFCSRFILQLGKLNKI